MTETEARRHDGGTYPTERLRHSVFWRVKLRLQFTGWLQYLITFNAAAAFLVISAIGWLLGAWRVVLFWMPLGIGVLLLATAIFDIVTVKWGLRPRERRPRRKDDVDTFDLILSRRSCRSFQARNLSAADREELVRTAAEYTRRDRLMGTGPIRLEHVVAPLTVWPSVGAREFFVAVAPRNYDRLAIIDVGRSLQKVVLHATRMGVATCWIGPGADHRSVVRHLGDQFDPDQDHIVCVCALGYRSHFEPFAIRVMERVQHRRLPLSALFFADPYFQRPLAVDVPPFASFGRCYEICQWSPSSYNGQTTRCAAVTKRVGTEEMVARFDFCATTNSRFYAPVALGIWCANWETGCDALGIRGHLAVLSAKDRGIRDAPTLPRYDVSWIADRQRR